jgi:hypothetical protein
MVITVVGVDVLSIFECLSGVVSDGDVQEHMDNTADKKNEYLIIIHFIFF